MTVIKICKGAKGWWFNGHWFYADRECEAHVDDLEALRAAILYRSVGIARWQGEPTLLGDTVSVGGHSLLVAYLAQRACDRLRITNLRPWIVRLAACHDLGETLGLGDIAAPWLRSEEHASLRVACDAHQLAVECLFGLSPANLHRHLLQEAVTSAREIVKKIDLAAAAYERRVCFGDDSGDCEAEGALEYLQMLGFVGAPPSTPKPGSMLLRDVIAGTCEVWDGRFEGFGPVVPLEVGAP